MEFRLEASIQGQILLDRSIMEISNYAVIVLVFLFFISVSHSHKDLAPRRIKLLNLFLIEFSDLYGFFCTYFLRKRQLFAKKIHVKYTILTTKRPHLETIPNITMIFTRNLNNLCISIDIVSRFYLLNIYNLSDWQ